MRCVHFKPSPSTYCYPSCPQRYKACCLCLERCLLFLLLEVETISVLGPHREGVSQEYLRMDSKDFLTGLITSTRNYVCFRYLYFLFARSLATFGKPFRDGLPSLIFVDLTHLDYEQFWTGTYSNYQCLRHLLSPFSSLSLASAALRRLQRWACCSSVEALTYLAVLGLTRYRSQLNSSVSGFLLVCPSLSLFWFPSFFPPLSLHFLLSWT